MVGGPGFEPWASRSWKMPTGVTVSALTKRREALNRRSTPRVSSGTTVASSTCAGVNKVPGLVKFEDFYRAPVPAGELVVGVGLSREGPLWADLTKVLHVLNGGQTDRGKSSWTRQVLTWLALRYAPEHVRFALIDLKGGLGAQRCRAATAHVAAGGSRAGALRRDDAGGHGRAGAGKFCLT
jgi:hypothetical protein